MSWINKISFYSGIRNEEPNKALAQELTESGNREGIAEIAGYLFDKNKSVCSDCLAVLYTIGYTRPELIQDYQDTFLRLLSSKNNRMVWGSMIALATISTLKADELYKELDTIINCMKTGTLITEVWGIKALVGMATKNSKYKERIQPLLFDYLEKCRPIDFATRVETLVPIIERIEEKEILRNIIFHKRSELAEAQVKKLNSILRKSKLE